MDVIRDRAERKKSLGGRTSERVKPALQIPTLGYLILST